METVILCGGKGTRLGSWGERIPKPLLPIGEEPLLAHLMRIYASFGHRSFVLALGHLTEQFEQYFEQAVERWDVRLVDTGPETPTGGRIKRCESYIQEDIFLATYGDGLADVDLDRLIAFHRQHGRIATITTVRPRTSFGIVQLGEDGHVTGFDEKPVLADWVNGGFFVFGRDIFGYLDDDSVLERKPFERLAADGELMAFRHDGFWACMDTYKDNLELNELWASGQARWKVWRDG